MTATQPERDDDGRTNGDSTSRRAVLRAVGATAVAGLGAAGTAGAAETVPDLSGVVDGYRTREAARAAVAAHARTPVEELAARGVLDSADLDRFDFDAAETLGLVLADGATAQVSVAAETATHQVTVVVRPQRGESYATARPTGDGDPVTARVDDDGVTVRDGVTTSSCGDMCQNYEDVQEHTEQVRLQDGSTEVVQQGCCFQ